MWFASLATHMNHPKPGHVDLKKDSQILTYNQRTIFSQDKAPTPFHGIQRPFTIWPPPTFPSFSPNPLQSLLEAFNAPFTNNNS